LRRGGEVAQIMYTHVSKYKNNKIKFKKNRRDAFRDLIAEFKVKALIRAKK
jgi:hypothetical protein